MSTRVAVTTATWVFALAGVGAAAPASGDAPGDYAYRWPLEAVAGAALQRVVIPAAVYEGAGHADLRDLRVFNAAGEAVPFAFVAPAPTAPPPARRFPLPVFPLRVDAAHAAAPDLTLHLRQTPAGTTLDLSTRDGRAVGGTIVAGYVVDASAVDVPLAALVLGFAGDAPVDTRVRVEASDDLATWRSVTAVAPLLRVVVGGRTLSRDRIDLASVKARYYRITPPAPGALQLADVIEGEAGATRVEATLASRDVQGAPEGATSGHFVYDAGAPFPVARVGLALAAVNTVAPAEVLARDAPTDEWRPAGAGVFYRLDDAGREVRNPPVVLAGAAHRYWKVVVDPRAGITAAPVLQIAWQPAEVVFTARGAPPYEVAYGRRDATPGALPIATLVPATAGLAPRDTAFPEARLAGAPRAANRAALTSPVELRRIALWAALLAAVGVLVTLGWRLLRQMPPETTPADSTPPRSG